MTAHGPSRRWRPVHAVDSEIPTIMRSADDGAMRVVWPKSWPDIRIGETVALKVGDETAIYQLLWVEAPLFPGEPVYVLRPSF